ncbi:MAG: response regulator [Proteobacteria bacterium]|nr:response regulator [Pseudomonadota bacterium]
MTHRVLVFENDERYSAELRAELESLGASVDVANNGLDGIKQAEDARPDLILLAVELDGMNGFLVCKKIKKNSNLRSVPLIILSSEATEETFEQHKRLRTRAQDYVRKPISAQDLVARARQLVELGGPAASTGDGADADISPAAPADVRAAMEANRPMEDSSRQRRNAGGSGRDILELKQQLNGKNREILDLRAQLASRDKQILAEREKSLPLERELADGRDRVLQLEHEMQERREEISALNQDKHGLEENVRTIEGELAAANDQLERARQELDGAAEVLAGEQRRMAEAADREKEKLAAEQAAAAAEERAEALEALRAEMAAEAESQRNGLQARHDETVQELRAHHDIERGDLQRRHAETVKSLQEEHSRKASEVEQELNQVREELKAKKAEHDAVQRYADELRAHSESLQGKLGRDEELLERTRRAITIGLSLLEEQKGNKAESSSPAS